MAKKINNYCKQPKMPVRVFNKNVSKNRAAYILSNGTRWVNGAQIKYMFFSGATAQKNIVRRAFEIWANLGIGISFIEVNKRADSMVRIAFDHSDGSWSYVGREILKIGKNEKTMNFGWDLTADAYGMTTALHEIGHTLGLQHEHQSPFSGITWDTEKVYKQFAGEPNNWTKSETHSNIIEKLSANKVLGSSWDPKSIMEYEFEAGLILKPVKYKNGIYPPGILSANDIKGIKKIYPKIKASAVKKVDHKSTVSINVTSGNQSDFLFVAPESKTYTFETKGDLDTVMVIHEKGEKENYYLAGDDDSGVEKNAKITLPLIKGKKYLVNIRALYAPKNKKGTLSIK